MKVVWTPEAEEDRGDIWDIIAADDLTAAVRMDQLFTDAAVRLADFPMLGHAGTILGTREWIPHESYRMVDEIDVDQNTLWVLALVHTARQWPPARSRTRL